jgi:four helix bundle protein
VCDQIRGSASSAPRNIAEGFGRGRPREFARFLDYALGSLNETKDALIDARDRRYASPTLVSRLLNLCGAAIRVTKRLRDAKRRQAAQRPAR